MMYDHPRRAAPSSEPTKEPWLSPAQRMLMLAAGPTFIPSMDLETPDSGLAAAVEPDDWRLYYLMRELSQVDRAEVLAFAELKFNLRHAQRWAEDRTTGPEALS